MSKQLFSQTVFAQQGDVLSVAEMPDGGLEIKVYHKKDTSVGAEITFNREICFTKTGAAQLRAMLKKMKVFSRKSQKKKRTIKEFMKNYTYIYFTGFSLTALGAPWNDWRFYAVLIPIIFFAEWRAK